MKLNDSFLAVQWLQGHRLKDYFYKNQMNKDWVNKSLPEPLTDEMWVIREHATRYMMYSPPKMKLYYLTQGAQMEAEKIAGDRKINTQWFKQMPDQDTMYITVRNEFYRFNKDEDMIQVLYFYTRPDGQPYYDSYIVWLDGREQDMLAWQQGEAKDRFLKLLLFIELGEVEVVELKPKAKVRYGKGGDDKVLNEAGLVNAFVVNANWNKIIRVTGGFGVRGHYRVQPCGEGRSQYKLIFIQDYTKKGYTYHKDKEG